MKDINDEKTIDLLMELAQLIVDKAKELHKEYYSVEVFEGCLLDYISSLF